MRVDDTGQGLLAFEVAGPPQRRPYRLALVDGNSDVSVAALDGCLPLVLRMADRVEIVAGAASGDRRQLELLVGERGLHNRVRISADRCVDSSSELDLVVAGPARIDRLAECNERRKEDGLAGFDVLCWPEPAVAFFAPGPRRRPFRLASVGGTFNKFHAGHEAYLRSALELADRVHVLIAADAYARPRKSYRPRRVDARTTEVAKFFASLGAGDRVEIEVLEDVTQIQQYVESSPHLDVVLAERAYVSWFVEWNERRAEIGLAPYAVVCRSRTSLGGIELSSSLLRRRRRPRMDQPRLFDAATEATGSERSARPPRSEPPRTG